MYKNPVIRYKLKINQNLKIPQIKITISIEPINQNRRIHMSRPKSMENEFRCMANLLILHISINIINSKLNKTPNKKCS